MARAGAKRYITCWRKNNTEIHGSQLLDIWKIPNLISVSSIAMVTPDSLHHQPSHTYWTSACLYNGIDYSDIFRTNVNNKFLFICLDVCFVDQQNANDNLRWLVEFRMQSFAFLHTRSYINNVIHWNFLRYRALMFIATWGTFRDTNYQKTVKGIQQLFPAWKWGALNIVRFSYPSTNMNKHIHWWTFVNGALNNTFGNSSQKTVLCVGMWTRVTDVSFNSPYKKLFLCRDGWFSRSSWRSPINLREWRIIPGRT